MLRGRCRRQARLLASKRRDRLADLSRRPFGAALACLPHRQSRGAAIRRQATARAVLAQEEARRAHEHLAAVDAERPLAALLRLCEKFLGFDEAGEPPAETLSKLDATALAPYLPAIVAKLEDSVRDVRKAAGRVHVRMDAWLLVLSMAALCGAVVR